MENDIKKRPLTLFFIVTILMSITANLAHPVTPTIIKNLNLNDYMFGAAFAAMMFSNFLFSPFWGKRNEYSNSKNTMAICSVGYSIGQLLFAIAKTEQHILGARVFSGVFAGGIFISFLTYLVHVSKEEERGRNLAILAALNSVASSFGYFIGGILGEISIMLVFIVQASLLLLCAILFLLVCRKDKSTKAKKIMFAQMIKNSNPFAAFLEAKRFINKRFVILFSVCALAYLGNTAFEQCFNYYIKDVFGLTSRYNGTIKAAIGIVSLVANATICIWMMRRTSLKKSIIYILLVCTVTIFGVSLTTSEINFIGISIFFFAINAITIPITQDLVSEEADPSESSIVMGFYNGIKSLGGIFGALTAGVLYTIQPTLPIIFAGIAFFAATIFALVFSLSTA
jgi:predicted MFS family arabinose efflux permease